MEPDTLAGRMIVAAYRAALDATAWQEVTAAIAEISDDLKCGLHAVDAVRQRMLHVGAGNVPSDAVTAYSQYFWTCNSYNPILARAGFGRVCQPTDREIDELVEPSEFHHDWLKPNRMGLSGTAIVVRGTAGGLLDLRVNHPRSRRATFDPMLGQAFAAAAPHLAHALDLSVRSATAAYLAGVGAAAATSPVPTLVIGGRARVLSANPAAEALLADGPLYVDRSGRLRARVQRDDEAVLSAMSAVVRESAAPALLRVRDFGAVGDVLLSFVPLGDAAGDTTRWMALLNEDAPVAVVYLSADGIGDANLETALVEVFDLDEQEARLAVALSRGQRLSAYAAARGIGTYEASLVLERVMDRLGTHRTADLVRKVASVARVLALPPRPSGF